MLEKKQIEKYKKQGAIVIRSIFKEWIDDLCIGVSKLMANPSPRERSYLPEDGSAPFFQDLCNWQTIPEFKNFIMNSPLGKISAELMNSSIAMFFHDHVLVKEKGSTLVTPWHQDQPYYCVNAMQNVSFWIPLDKINKKTSLKCVSGSHLGGKLHKPKRFNGTDLYENDQSEEMPDIDLNIHKYKILSWDLEPGDAIAFNFKIIHGADGNIHQNSRRRIFSARVVGDDARFLNKKGKGSPTFEHLKLKTGDKLNIPDFPIIYN